MEQEQMGIDESAPSALRGALAGLVGGLVASGAMNIFQSAWQAAAGTDSSGGGEPSTVKAAEKLAPVVGEAPIPQRSKPTAGNAVHYAFGAALGTAYGVVAEYMPRIKTGAGSAFGIGSMLLFDDAAVPAAGLGQSPTQSSASTNAYSAASHLVYGVSLETIRQVVRRVV
jgi:putative membrane protein